MPCRPGSYAVLSWHFNLHYQRDWSLCRQRFTKIGVSGLVQDGQTLWSHILFIKSRPLIHGLLHWFSIIFFNFLAFFIKVDFYALKTNIFLMLLKEYKTLTVLKSFNLMTLVELLLSMFLFYCPTRNLFLLTTIYR